MFDGLRIGSVPSASALMPLMGGDRFDEYRADVQQHADDWFARNGQKYGTDAGRQAAWEKAWEKDGAEARRKLGVRLAEWQNAVKNELLHATGTRVPEQPETRQGTIDRTADERGRGAAEQRMITIDLPQALAQYEVAKQNLADLEQKKTNALNGVNDPIRVRTISDGLKGKIDAAEHNVVTSFNAAADSLNRTAALTIAEIVRDDAKLDVIAALDRDSRQRNLGMTEAQGILTAAEQQHQDVTGGAITGPGALNQITPDQMSAALRTLFAKHPELFAHTELAGPLAGHVAQLKLKSDRFAPDAERPRDPAATTLSTTGDVALPGSTTVNAGAGFRVIRSRKQQQGVKIEAILQVDSSGDRQSGNELRVSRVTADPAETRDRPDDRGVPEAAKFGGQPSDETTLSTPIGTAPWQSDTTAFRAEARKLTFATPADALASATDLAFLLEQISDPPPPMEPSSIIAARYGLLKSEEKIRLATENQSRGEQNGERVEATTAVKVTSSRDQPNRSQAGEPLVAVTRPETVAAIAAWGKQQQHRSPKPLLEQISGVGGAEVSGESTGAGFTTASLSHGEALLPTGDLRPTPGSAPVEPIAPYGASDASDNPAQFRGASPFAADPGLRNQVWVYRSQDFAALSGAAKEGRIPTGANIHVLADAAPGTLVEGATLLGSGRVKAVGSIEWGLSTRDAPPDGNVRFAVTDLSAEEMRAGIGNGSLRYALLDENSVWISPKKIQEMYASGEAVPLLGMSKAEPGKEGWSTGIFGLLVPPPTHARVYRGPDLAALQADVARGRIPPGRHVFAIGTSDPGPTLQNGSTLDVGKVRPSGGAIQWEGRNRIALDDDLLFVVTRHGETTIQNRMATGEGIGRYDVYDGARGWIPYAEITAAYAKGSIGEIFRPARTGDPNARPSWWTPGTSGPDAPDAYVTYFAPDALQKDEAALPTEGPEQLYTLRRPFVGALPTGLEQFAADVHPLDTGNGQRSGDKFLDMIARAGTNSRVLLGGQDPDLWVIKDFDDLFASDPQLAAKADIALAGLEFAEAAYQKPVAYAAALVEASHGRAFFSGELAGGKGFGTNVEGAKFREFLDFSLETKMGILLQDDWRGSGANPKGGTFSERVEVFGEKKYRSANVVFAHSGVGDIVGPGDTPVTGDVNVVHWDWKNNQPVNVETKTVTASEHIHKLYRLFEKVPNARADIAWNDLDRAYTADPDLREGLITFVLDHQDRVMLGSDTVKPVARGLGEAHSTGTPILVEISRRDPMALWKLLRGNYEEMMGSAEQGVYAWTRAQFVEKGRTDRIVKMDEIRDTLADHRADLLDGAWEHYMDWLENLATVHQRRTA